MNLPTLNEFKLSCELLGHSMDVRSVCRGGDSKTIISGSRDKSVKIWRMNELGSYDEIATLKHHKNFVSCVYYLESENWICTGGNDSTIFIYKDGVCEPFASLRSHEGTVCSIYKGLKKGSIISGSWDQTAIVWSIQENGEINVDKRLKGHEAAVWAVTSIPSMNKYVTGSADKNIIFWNEKGEKVKVLKGHTDCVRGLIDGENGSLISCSNDATIRYWNNEGECLRELLGHTNFIYSIARNIAIGPDVVLSGGEDSTIRLWSMSEGNLGDELTLPAQSVWSVACLANGDLVTGTSDGVVRVFTRDLNRAADSEKLKVYQLAVETRKAEKNATIGGYNKNNLPGPEILNQPGNKEGDTKMIRQPDGKVMCYMWEKNKWNLLGDVVGASGGTQESSGKTLYEGKEYDYVFSVDISDTEPPKKLPYNNGEDPWHAAQKFIHKNDLPQVYLDQVANFIVKNSNAQVIQQTSVTAGYQDPFTGGNRYVPGSSINNVTTGGNLDPFTGASSYTTTAANKPNVNVNFTSGKIKHFPFTKFSTFDTYDATKVLNKLREFNDKAGELSTTEEMLTEIVKLADANAHIDPSAADMVLKLLHWPKDVLFPVLDIVRLAVRDEQIYSYLKPSTFLENILPNINSTVPNQLMTVRCIVNLMNHQSGRETIFIYLDKIVSGIISLKSGSPNLQIAIATFYLNLSASQIQGNTKAEQDKCEMITEGIIEFLKWAADLEASYRSIQALGNLSCTPFCQLVTAQIVSVDIVMDKIREMANIPQPTGWEKINQCANALIAMF